MLKSLHIKNFKSLRDVRLELGLLNIFIGTNASGKSNVFDALRVLQGIGNGFTVSEIFDGKPQSATSERWEGIRGGSSQAAFKDGSSEPVSFEIETAETSKSCDHIFKIGFSTSFLKVTEEQFCSKDEIYSSRANSNPSISPVLAVRYLSGKPGNPPRIDCDASRPILAQLAQGHHGQWSKKHVEEGVHFARSLANMQRIDPIPSVLREYSRVQNVFRMGERGENFAALIQKICEDPATSSKDAYLAWLKELRPAEVDDVITITGAVGDKMFALMEGERRFPAPVLSDGTLRFAAIAAAFFQPDMPNLLTIEEIENGIHASRLRLLVELLRSQTQRQKTQVIATTHSPIVLAWLQEQEYAHTFFCKRDEQTGESKILPLIEIPHFNEIVKKQPIGDLFAEGWMEAAL